MGIKRLGSAGLTTVEFLILTVVLGVFMSAAMDQFMSSLGAGLLTASLFFVLAVIGEKFKWPGFPAAGVILGVIAGGAVSLDLVAKVAEDPQSHYARLIRKSNEAVTKGNLKAAREALKTRRDGIKWGEARLKPHHADSATVRLSASPDDAGGWLYDAAAAKILVNCTHTDTFGSVWTAY